MNIKFFFKKEKQLIDKELINSLLSRYDKIYQEKIYKTNRDNIYEFSDNTILKEPLFELVLNKIHEKFQLIVNQKDLKFNKLWLVLTEKNFEKKNVLPYIPHIDKQRYLKAMVYLHDVTLEHGPIHLGKVKEDVNIEFTRKNLPKNYKEKGLNTIGQDLIEGELSPVLGEAGDVIFFDTNTPHKAGEVKAGFSRKVLRFDFERIGFNDTPNLFKSLINKILNN